MRRRFGITGKLALSSICIFFGLGLAVIWYSVAQLRSVLYDQMVRRVEAQALNWIQTNFTQLTVTRDSGTLKQRIRELAEQKAIAYVMLDLQDVTRKLSLSYDVPDGLASTGAAPPVAAISSQVIATKDAKGQRYFELVTPISSAGTGMNADLAAAFAMTAESPTLGRVHVGFEQQEIKGGVDVPRSVMLYGALVLLALAVNLMLAKRMVTPIAAMGQVANQIAGGNLSQRVRQGVDLQDEVGELVRNFNQMATRLAESRTEMDLLYAGLEEKVRERTVELEQANRRLQELDRLKSQFLSTVSHELRTPLTSIKAYTEILLDSPIPNPEMRRRFLEIIDKESDRLTRLISDLLDLAKIESGAAQWRMGDTDLQQVVDAAVAPLRSLAAEKDIALEMVGSEPLLVWADSDRIQQVITNLIGNAIKFSPPRERVEIRICRSTTSGPRHASEGDYALVAVSDAGPGIAPEEKERVFERFYRGTGGHKGPAGTGLGLTISREIVLHHKGEIWMESEPGFGSTFYFTVPVGKAAGVSSLAAGRT